MKVIIDERETFLYAECVRFADTYPAVQLSKAVLPLGDIMLKIDDDQPFIIIERKSISDLLASIKDGRYEEQSYRLKNSDEFSTHHIVYLIEGMFTFATDKKLVYSAMTSLQFFKGFRVQRTCSLIESAEWIMHLADKTDRDLKKGKCLAYSSTTGSPENYCTVVKKVKKDNITPENMGEIILCQIPGISANTAIAIMKHTNGSFLQLLEVLKTNPSELENIMVGDKKPRKISKKLIESLAGFLLV
jgi:ERCC4-type nuclease